jgi:NAD(P)-dependent dehydrogenase (short-subunit alcohol dehydrogenase family)
MKLATFHDLEGASVFITGGGNGIGATLTQGFLEQGAKVTFVGRSNASEFVDEMAAQTGNRPLFIQCDVTIIPDLHAAMAQAEKAHGPLNVLVNNAANDQRFDALDVTETDWDAMQAINLKHYFFACQYAANSMQGRGGAIVNYSSTSYMIGSLNLQVYVAANAGIVGLTRSLAREWGPQNIRVNAIAPGWVMTEKQKEKWVTPESIAAHLERQCIPTAMEPEDMIGGTLFLASNASKMMTGQCIAIDGGVVVTG